MMGSPMLRIQNLQYAIAERRILDGIDWILNPGRRVALVGPNGAGKTTLLRLIVGEVTPEAGQIQTRKDYAIGYLPQEPLSLEEGTLLDVAMSTHPELMTLERKIWSLQQEMSETCEDQPSLMDALGEALHRYEALDGYSLEAEAKTVLKGLGFKAQDVHRPISEFSGGWRMRGYLTRLLLQSPDLLLLDEPTNHLDVEALEWLEGYLQSFRGGMVIVSHDRFFIDRLAQEICHLHQGKLKRYQGNYRQYEIQKQEEEEFQEKRHKEQQEEVARQKAFIERFRAKATKAAQVQSRIKALQKMEVIEGIKKRREFTFRFRVSQRSYKEVLQIEGAHFRYGDDWVLRDLNLRMFRGDRVALVGPNGTGKTTLTRLIKEELTPQKGSVQIGQRVRIGHYAQHQVESLNLGSSVFDEVYASASDSMAEEVRTVLGLFQFTGDDVFKRIGILSGGEKARVSLAKMLVSPCNFLLMDEPVNHLDVTSRAALETALSNYDGTMLIISHDRYFLDKLVDRVVELREGRLDEYLGNYSRYLELRQERQEMQLAATENVREKDAQGVASPAQKRKEQKRREAEARNALSRKLKPVKEKLALTEGEVQILETRKSEMEETMSLPETYEDVDGFVNLQKDYARVCEELDEQVTEWEKAQDAYERILQEFER